MRARPKRNPRIDFQHQIALSDLRLLMVLPGRFDHNVLSNPERMEKFLPVVDPVPILCLGYGKRPLSYIGKHGKLL